MICTRCKTVMIEVSRVNKWNKEVVIIECPVCKRRAEIDGHKDKEPRSEKRK